MRSKRRTVAALFAFFASVCPTIIDAEASGIAPNQEERQLARMIVGHAKQQRVDLKMDPILHRVARQKAMDMARRGYFSHTTPEGVGPNLAVRRAGFRLPTWYGTSRDANNIESISAGVPSPGAAFAGWLRSGSHRQHVLGTHPFYRSHNRFGVGCVEVPGSRYQRYYVFLSAPARQTVNPRPVAATIPAATHRR